MTEQENKKRDALWTYIGQSTWVLQITPMRYLIRSTYRNVLDGGQHVSYLYRSRFSHRHS